jgi:hypothetical protein
MGRVNRLGGLAIAAAAISLAALAGPGGLGAVGGAQAEAAVTSAASTSYTVPDGNLLGVAATSASNAWAVGELFPAVSGYTRPLLLHWNGRTWSRAKFPQFTYGELDGIAAVSAADVWVVGTEEVGAPGIVILHWNGRTWSRVSNITVSDIALEGVAVAATAHDVWVAAYDGNLTQLLHLTGGRWYIVPTSLPVDYQVNCIAVVNSKLAWLSGVVFKASGNPQLQSFLARWNGSVWKQVVDPIAKDAGIWGMASGPAGAVWAVGDRTSLSTTTTSMRWGGKSWHPVNSPGINGLSQAAFIPGGTAWAVGAGLSGGLQLIVHWTGSTWKEVAAPAIAGGGELAAVTATSTRNAWAVGQSDAGSLILHWNGKTWS